MESNLSGLKDEDELCLLAQVEPDRRRVPSALETSTPADAGE